MATLAQGSLIEGIRFEGLVGASSFKRIIEQLLAELTWRGELVYQAADGEVQET